MEQEKTSSTKTFPDSHLCSVVIRGGRSILSIENAIQSCIRNAQYIKAVFIESEVFDLSSPNCYPDWAKDLKSLQSLGLNPTWQTEFNPDSVESGAIIEMNPCQQVYESAFVKLYHRITMTAPGYDHYAMSSGIEIVDNRSKFDPGIWLSMFGFSLSFFFWVMDGYRYLLNFGGYHRWSDLKIHTIVRTFPRKSYISPYKSCRWLFFTGVDYCLPFGEDNKQVVKNTNGFDFTHEYLRTDPNLSFRRGFRWLFLYGLLVLYYTHVLWTSPFWLGLWHNPFWTLNQIRWIVFIIYGIQTIPVITVIFINVYKFPFHMSALLCLLFPVTAALSPFVLLWAKLFTIKSSKEFTHLKAKKEE